MIPEPFLPYVAFFNEIMPLNFAETDVSKQIEGPKRSDKLEGI